jgi:hypothetical protein
VDYTKRLHYKTFMKVIIGKYVTRVSVRNLSEVTPHVRGRTICLSNINHSFYYLDDMTKCFDASTRTGVLMTFSG